MWANKALRMSNATPCDARSARNPCKKEKTPRISATPTRPADGEHDRCAFAIFEPAIDREADEEGRRQVRGGNEQEGQEGAASVPSVGAEIGHGAE